VVIARLVCEDVYIIAQSRRECLRAVGGGLDTWGRRCVDASSLPGKVRRSNPAWQRRVLVVGFLLWRGAIISQSEDVAGECVALGGIDFDELYLRDFRSSTVSTRAGGDRRGGAFVE